ncbi:glycosyltransferase [Niabella drilacis]|uniref:Glycosyltransferase, catalytic subunit of cellulose synthase and poly-beta-1,6-N-acetylglucosamine synthase n=1 Tax=Niabella drilacis (strain DSM 25811 / CCM 8410 / CCUG 62505 / LMG 26954 / E90) TaxID=1285928 RepID=A0A1G6Z4B0_NIADE|nr:glycosyltransferase [Niabella drilacis]SDD96646.1 Glycosyltransferase, catalytic subunit of cellulose synthase and poly-beta-1,6-N-acetylglucosamine synthase [Niabella drilacis]
METRTNGPEIGARPRVKGKFIFCDNKKYFIKGVTYGTFAPDIGGHQFPPLWQVEQDFRLMQASGINSVRVYTVPPAGLLDLAAQYNLKIMVGLPWEQHITFLDKDTRGEIIQRVGKAVAACAQHPAILCYTIGNEIPASIVRWYGKKKVEKFLRQLFDAVKLADPEGLVTYVNYPTTEYLNLDFLDFYSINVYLETPEKLSGYLARLHNLCGDRPLLLAEMGLDSQRNGEEQQAAAIGWQIQMVLGKGCAGLFVFSWTDEWWRGGLEILDWDFGIVDRQRRPKPAMAVVAGTFSAIQQSINPVAISFSVVVCSYNGSKTIGQCLEGILQLRYDNYEVIVVDDGSRDNLAEIVSRYPVQLIRTPNRGLSNARNTGMKAATGEVIAYIDDDAYPDPDWLNYLSYAFTHGDYVAVGGPNLVPGEDGGLAACVGCAPGGPLQVLVTDEIAEHIPGCNMVIRRQALLDIGGFDPRYRAAGDDVDVCWRLQEAGGTIGYHPGALVWHHRRNSFRAYWKQQKGYGKAEALLEQKWPERYNALGHYNWDGSIYGAGTTFPIPWKKKKIFFGSWGSAPFQSVYSPSRGWWGLIPLMPEWGLLCAALGVVGFLGLVSPVWFGAWGVLAICLMASFIQIIYSAGKNWKASKRLGRHYKYLWIIIGLHFVQPAARLIGRVQHGLTPWRKRRGSAGVSTATKTTTRGGAVWSETWKAPHEWLTVLETNLAASGAQVKRGHTFDRWDLESIHHLVVAMRSTVLVEEHGQGRQYLKLRFRPRFFRFPVAIGIFLLAVGALALFRQQWTGAALLAAMLLVLINLVWSGYRQSLATVMAAFHQLQFDAKPAPLVVDEMVSVPHIQPEPGKTSPALLPVESQ